MLWFYIALVSALGSAAASIFEKKTLFKEGALEFTTVLAFFNMVLALPFFWGADFSTMTTATLGILFGKTILNALAFLCVMYGLKNLELSGALPLLVITPGLVAIGALIFLGESLKYTEIGGMLLLLGGTYVLHVGKQQHIWGPFKIFFTTRGYHYIIYALLLFTVTSLLDRLLLGKYKVPAYTFMALQHVFLAVIFAGIFIVFMRKPSRLLLNDKYSYLWIFLVSLLTMVYRYSEIVAIKMAISVALVLAVKRTSVFFAAIIGGKIFDEHRLAQKTCAIIIMITGALLIEGHLTAVFKSLAKLW